jgi:hypothetical protein
LPVGVEAYAAYALRAWLARDPWITSRTRRFARWSAICSFALGMAGQIAYHLLAQAGAARAPWPVTTVVSCLPVLVLAMGTALAHMLRGDAGTATETPANGRAGPATPPRPACPGRYQTRPVQDQSAGQGTAPLPGPQPRTRPVPVPDRAVRTSTPLHAETGRARLAASRLAASGSQVSRRALRNEGIRGSNQALNALARQLNAELSDSTRGQP